MNTQTLVRGSADVITVTTLARHDVYKRLEKPDYSGTYSLRFGVVTDVLHNGEDAAITALEFSTDYSGTEPKLMVFGTDSDLKLFAATPEEFGEHKAEVEKKAQRAVDEAEKALGEKRRILAAVESAFTAEVLTQLTPPTVQALGTA